MDTIAEQKKICLKYKVDFFESSEEMKLGVALNIKSGFLPIHGLRHPPQNGTTGWYLWAGDFSEESDFFKPLHIKHLDDWTPLVKKYLGLPPGWRFLIGQDGYEDVWFDESLLKI